MIRTTFGLLALLVLLPALQARDKPEKQTPEQQYQALVQEYNKAVQEYNKALRDAKTPQDRRKVMQEKSPPQPIKFAKSFLELAEKNPKDPAAVDALIWVAAKPGAAPSGAESPRTKAIEILLRDHIQSEKMATVCQNLRFARDEESHKLLLAVLEKNKHRSAQAQACLALAQQADTKLRMARRVKDTPGADPEKLSKEAEKYYERIAKDFADVSDGRGGKLGKMAEMKLEALRHPILVGKLAPEIEAEDIDGKTFKLSDYRGKVVLLDFWGHW